MNYTTKRINPKQPETADYTPPRINNSAISPALSNLIEKSVKPDVLDKIRELDNSASADTQLPNVYNKPIPRHSNPLRARSGLYFRDIMNETHNIRNITGESSRTLSNKSLDNVHK
jgi:hypothetical protein